VLTRNIGRRPGQKEERWATPLVAAGDTSADSETTPPHGLGGIPTAAPIDLTEDLRSELAELRSSVAELRQEVQELRESLGG
jgi:uncharacterized protein YceH (UPF0502 family)